MDLIADGNLHESSLELVEELEPVLDEVVDKRSRSDVLGSPATCIAASASMRKDMKASRSSSDNRAGRSASGVK